MYGNSLASKHKTLQTPERKFCTQKKPLVDHTFNKLHSLTSISVVNIISQSMVQQHAPPSVTVTNCHLLQIPAAKLVAVFKIIFLTFCHWFHVVD